MKGTTTLIAAGVLALGMAIAGWSVGDGFARGRSEERFVTVKGVAERPATANLALWPFSFVVTADSLAEAQRKVGETEKAIDTFLERHQLDPSSVHLQGMQVDDLMADRYRNAPIRSRFIVTETLIVRSDQPERVQAASQAVGELLEAGVVLSNYGGPASGPTYLFTGLNDLKPEMIAEATSKAREAAEQFARDSESRLGGIRRANQGVFVILPRDRAPGVVEGSQPDKTVRVVTTVEYYLTD